MRFVIAFLLPLYVFCQNPIMTESLVGIHDKYKPLFGKEQAFLSMDFVRVHELGSTDTSYTFLINVNTVNREIESSSIGSSVFNIDIWNISSNTSYTFNRSDGSMIMDYATLQEFYRAANVLYSFFVKRLEYDTVITQKINDITIGYEYRTGFLDDNQRFFFKLGDATFTMYPTDFTKIFQKVAEAKKIWESKRFTKP